MAEPAESAEQIGPYTLRRLLGVGGMAQTFVGVRELGTGQDRFSIEHCVKRILPEFAEDEEFRRLFLREAKLASHLRHPNIVQIADFGETDGDLYMALELVDGIDLGALLRRQDEPLSAPLLVLIALELADALAYAHAEGVLHRDISPGNALVSIHGDIKLSDFGIAKRAGERTSTGGIRGKIPYIPPETWTTTEFDARSDLFGLGVMLYELAARRRPFDGNDEFETRDNILNGERPRLGSLRSGLPALLETTIERLIAHSPADRPGSAAELHSILEPITPRVSVRRELAERVSAAMQAKRRPATPLGAPASSVKSESDKSGPPVPTRPFKIRSSAQSGSSASAATGPIAIGSANREAAPRAPTSSAEVYIATRLPRDPALAPTLPPPDEHASGRGTLQETRTSLPRTPHRVPAIAAIGPTPGAPKSHFYPIAALTGALLFGAVVFGTLMFKSLGSSLAVEDTATADPPMIANQTPSTRESDRNASDRVRQEPSPRSEQSALVAELEASEAVPNSHLLPARVPTSRPVLPQEQDLLPEEQDDSPPAPAVEPSHDHDEPTDQRPERHVSRASVEIYALPAGEIFIDGHSMGPSPVQAMRLRPGSHRIEARYNGRRRQRTLVLEPGRNAQLILRMLDAQER